MDLLNPPPVLTHDFHIFNRFQNFTMFSSSKKISLLVFTLSFSSLASAQFSDESDFQGPDHAREGGRVSLSVSSKVDYSDSDAPKASVKPELEYKWANGWFAGTNRGVGFNFSKNLTLQYGLGLGVDFGRKESNTGALAGMGSIDAKVEYGAFLNYAPDRHWRLSSALRYGSGDTGEGATTNFGANYAIDIAPKWRLDVGVSTTWANSQYMQSYFGVNAAQSLTSGKAEYSAASGIRDVGAGLNLSYQLTPNISVSGGIKTTSLVGDARNSPLATSPQNVSGSLSAGYAF